MRLRTALAIVAVSALIPSSLLRAAETAFRDSDEMVLRVTSPTLSLAAIVTLLVLGLVPLPRVARLLSAWGAALYCCFYLAMVHETPTTDIWMGQWRVSRPFGRESVELALLGAGVFCIVFAVYATVRRRTDEDAVCRVLYGPLAFAGVIGLAFLAKELVSNSDYMRNTPNVWERIADRFWLACVPLVVVPIIAELRIRSLRRRQRDSGSAGGADSGRSGAFGSLLR